MYLISVEAFYLQRNVLPPKATGFCRREKEVNRTESDVASHQVVPSRNKIGQTSGIQVFGSISIAKSSCQFVGVHT